MGGLIDNLGSMSIPFALWNELLANLSNQERDGFMIYLSHLCPAIIHLGGTEALTATAEAVIDICKQWH